MMYRINAPIRKDDSSKAIFANKQTIPKASNTGNAISFKIIFTKKPKILTVTHPFLFLLYRLTADNTTMSICTAAAILLPQPIFIITEYWTGAPAPPHAHQMPDTEEYALT